MAIIGIKRPDGSSAQLNTSGFSKDERLARQLLDDSATFSGADPSVLEEKDKTPQYPEGVTQKRFLEKVSSALSNIEDLREQQLELAERAEDTADPEYRAALETESDTLDAEVNSIVRADGFSGQNVFQGQTLLVQNELEGFAAVNSFTPFGSIISSAVNADFSSSAIERTQTSIESLLAETRRAYADNAGKLSEADDNLETHPKVVQVSTVTDEFQTVTEYDEAKRAADSARTQILNLALQSEPGDDELPFHKQELNTEKILSLLDGS